MRPDLDPVAATCLQALADAADPAGGWEYHAGRLAQVEPTSLAVLALSLDSDRQQPLLDAGLTALRA